MNEFAKKLYSYEAEALFAPMMPRINQIAQLVVDEVRMMISDQYYVKPRTLIVS